MAEKKNPSRAERAVSDVKKNSGSSNSKASSKPKTTSKKKSTKADKAAQLITESAYGAFNRRSRIQKNIIFAVSSRSFRGKS